MHFKLPVVLQKILLEKTEIVLSSFYILILIFTLQ